GIIGYVIIVSASFLWAVVWWRLWMYHGAWGGMNFLSALELLHGERRYDGVFIEMFITLFLVFIVTMWMVKWCVRRR
ncbi:MAG: hypothetical protein CTY21_14265, partial [Methylomonas sp.]